MRAFLWGGRFLRFSETTATDGTAVTGTEAANKRMLYAFFSIDCKACWPKVPAFVTYVRQLGLGTDQVVSSVVGAGAASDDSVAQLESVGRVVMEPTGRSLCQARWKHGASPRSYLLVWVGPSKRTRWLDGHAAVGQSVRIGRHCGHGTR